MRYRRLLVAGPLTPAQALDHEQTITVHLLDAPGRVHRFERKHPDLAERVPRKELAASLTRSAETLSRLKQRAKI